MSKLTFYGDRCVYAREAFNRYLSEEKIPARALLETLMAANAPLEVSLRFARMYLNDNKIRMLTRGQQSVESLIQQLYQINATERAVQREEQNRAESSVINKLLLKASQGEKPWLLAELAKRQQELEVAKFFDTPEKMIPVKEEWYPKLEKSFKYLEEIAKLQDELTALREDYNDLC